MRTYNPGSLWYDIKEKIVLKVLSPGGTIYPLQVEYVDKNFPGRNKVFGYIEIGHEVSYPRYIMDMDLVPMSPLAKIYYGIE